MDAAFDSSLAARGVDRRRWQVLATLARCSTPRQSVLAGLSSFDEPVVVDTVVDDLHARGWVTESDGLLRLTPEGLQEQEALAPLVTEVRQHVTAALPRDDYLTFVRLLSRLVAAFPDPSR